MSFDRPSEEYSFRPIEGCQLMGPVPRVLAQPQTSVRDLLRRRVGLPSMCNGCLLTPSAAYGLKSVTTKLEEEFMAGPCLTTAPTVADPLIINAKPGQINLKLTGMVVFDPSGTDVTTTTDGKVPFICSPQALSFTGVSGTSYFVEMLHAGTMDTSTGHLQEDCAAAVTFAILSPADAFSRLLVVVA